MALNTKFNIIVILIEKTSVNNKEAYRVMMPSGLETLAWSTDLILI